MSESDGRDRPGLTLLIQLFGREVLDRLARAGYDDESAIAAAGPDRLASTSGVSLPLAQRIVAVVQEARGPSTEPSRTPREPRRRKALSTRTAPKRPEPRVETVTAKADPDEVDPFVDDVALVAWMGFSSKAPVGRLSFSVADRILDPVRPEPFATEEPLPPLSATPATETRPASPAQDGAPRRTLPGSFWSFGRPAESGSSHDEEATRPPETPAPRGGAAPRRVRDDH
jgi:hypothetical protein